MQLKHGLRGVRPPKEVIEALAWEHHRRGGKSRMHYYVRRVTPDEASYQSGSHVAFRCTAKGQRLPGASYHHFNPKRYQPRPRVDFTAAGELPHTKSNVGNHGPPEDAPPAEAAPEAAPEVGDGLPRPN